MAGRERGRWGGDVREGGDGRGTHGLHCEHAHGARARAVPLVGLAAEEREIVRLRSFGCADGGTVQLARRGK